jgi:hypothetical protein
MTFLVRNRLFHRVANRGHYTSIASRCEQTIESRAHVVIFSRRDQVGIDANRCRDDLKTYRGGVANPGEAIKRSNKEFKKRRSMLVWAERIRCTNALTRRIWSSYERRGTHFTQNFTALYVALLRGGPYRNRKMIDTAARRILMSHCQSSRTRSMIRPRRSYGSFENQYMHRRVRMPRARACIIVAAASIDCSHLYCEDAMNQW